MAPYFNSDLVSDRNCSRFSAPDRELHPIATGKRDVTARLAIRVARYLQVSVDELLEGRAVVGRMCHHCGRPLDDFEDEDTRAE